MPFAVVECFCGFVMMQFDMAGPAQTVGLVGPFSATIFADDHFWLEVKPLVTLLAHLLCMVRFYLAAFHAGGYLWPIWILRHYF